MSDDQPENVSPVLRREALLPNERSRGLGTVAVVCTMAGVASGLALATTLMAMQVADSMSSRSCPYREARLISNADRGEHGFLGITYTVPDKGRNIGSYAQIARVLPDTPAAAAGLRAGDHVLSVNNMRVTSTDEFFEHIFNMRPGATPSLVVNRRGDLITVRPTLVAWPSVVID